VLLTRTRDKKPLEEAMKSGFTTYLNRPVSGPKLQQGLLSLFHSNPEDIPENSSTRESSAKESRGVQKSESGKSILLAEDNTIIQKMVQMQLNRLGYAVRIVSNGKEAIGAANESCSLILMDCKMPLMDGFKAAQTIRTKKLRGNRIPIIAMTAGTQQGEENQISKAGMDDFLTKPIQIENLANMLEKWIPKLEPDGWIDKRAPDATPIELNRIGDSFGPDKDIIREFLEVYQDSAETLLKKARKNLEKRNRSALTENSQELRGSSSNVGAAFMAGLCSYLESEKDSKNWKRSHQIVKEMEEELQRIKSFIHKLA
jgi:two-component system, sensor histidine kinase and response regulator